MDIMRGVPGATEVLKAIHGSRQLPHDVRYEKVNKISWSDIKGRKYRGSDINWVLVRGDKGMGAIRAAKSSYDAVVLDSDGEIVKKHSEKGGDVLDFLKSYIGRMTEFYVGRVDPEHRETIKTRQARKPIPIERYSGDENFVKLLMKKFRPLWIRSIEAAISDMKGWAQTMIKNHNFEKAKSKMEKLQMLEEILEKIRDGEDPMNPKKPQYGYARDTFEVMKRSLHNAIMLTAHHYYPDSSGGFSGRGYGRQHSLMNNNATEQLFNDIINGDTKKLSTLIAFLRRELVTA